MILVRALFGSGSLANWLMEVPDGAVIDVISPYADLPLMLGNHSIFDIHYSGRFLFYSGGCTRALLEMLIAEGPGDIRITKGAFLHAKIYRVTWPNGHDNHFPNEQRTYWVIGSANFTRPGMNFSLECITVFEENDPQPFSEEEWEEMIAPNGRHILTIPEGITPEEATEILDLANQGGWLRRLITGGGQVNVQTLPNPGPLDQLPPESNDGWGFALTMTAGGLGGFENRYRIIPRSCYQGIAPSLHDTIYPVFRKHNPDDDPWPAILFHDSCSYNIGIWAHDQAGQATTHLYLTGLPNGIDYDTSHVIRVSNIQASDGTLPVVDFPAVSEVENSLNFYNLNRNRRWAIYDYPEE